MNPETDRSYWDDDRVRRALAEDLAAISDSGATFKIVEFGVDGVAVWTVSRDSNGTPLASRDLLATPWIAPELLYQEWLAPRTGTTRLRIVYGIPGFDPRREEELRVLHERQPDVPFHRCASPVWDMLRQVVRESPITRFYELVALTEKGESRRLVSDNIPLFAPSARRGDVETFQVRCVSGGPRGTVFAVVSRDDYTIGEPAISAVSVQLPPGIHTVTARLDRPGRVDFEFEGLFVDPRPDGRRIPDLLATLPDRLVRLPAVHIVCLIEVSGEKKQVQDRIDRLTELVGMVDAPDRDVQVSVVSYGPHSFDGVEREEPVKARAWVVDAAAALLELSDLRGQSRPKDEFTLAAQLECALTKVAGNLDPRDGQLVLVTAGSRPPHPPRADVRAPRVIRCPSRYDWQDAVSQLASLPGATFGAFTERDALELSPIWDQLGRHAMGSVTGTSMATFAAALRLAGEAQQIPFPLVVEA